MQARTTVSIRSPSRGIEHGLRRRSDSLGVDGLTASLASASSTNSGEPWRMIVQSDAKLRSEIVDIRLADGCFGPEDANDARCRHLRGRLDRRDRADDRQVERRPDMFERDGRSGVAGDDRQARMKSFDEAAEQGRDSAGDLRLAALAVGEAGAVGSVDDRRVRQQLQRRPEHRQPADAGIEEEDGCVGVHRRFCGRRRASSRKLRSPFRFATTLPMTREMLFALALGYLLGSIPFGLVLTRLVARATSETSARAISARQTCCGPEASRSPSLTLILDCLKATAAILLAQKLFGDGRPALRRRRRLHRSSLSRLARVSGRQGSRNDVRHSHRAAVAVRRIVYAAVWLLLLLTIRISSVAGMARRSVRRWPPWHFIRLSSQCCSVSRCWCCGSTAKTSFASPGHRATHWESESLIEDLVDRLRLLRTPGIGPVTFRQLIRRFGTAAAALDAVPDLARRGGGKTPLLWSRDQAEREIARVEKLGARNSWLWVRASILACLPSSRTRRRCSWPRATSTCSIASPSRSSARAMHRRRRAACARPGARSRPARPRRCERPRAGNRQRRP